VDLATRAAAEFTAWRAGDQGGLERLVQLVTPVIWHIVRSYRLERELAEDAVQSTWFALVRYAQQVREPRSILRWLTITARREAWRVAREARREDATEAEKLESASPAVPGPETAVLADRTARVLWRHVAQLSPECQHFLRIIAFGERPNLATLSAQTGRAVGGMGPTRRRCLEKLRGRLRDDPEWSRP
jgi:RNA polymerase sigma factor (sigma-70 family)